MIPETAGTGHSFWNPKSLTLIAGALLLAITGFWLVMTGDPSPSRSEPPVGQTFSGRPSIAVLPFLNVSADPGQEYFSDGITEDLVTDISKVQGLDVMARNSVLVYKGSRKDEQIIGRELGVGYVLTGTIQKADNRVRINVQLIDVSDGRNLWAERYDRQLGDIFEIQDDLAAHIVSAMEVNLAPADRQRLSRNYIADVDAYDAFLRGLEHHGRRSPDGSRLAKMHFQRAIALDPGFARAYAGLALAHSRDAIDGWGPSVGYSLEQANDLAQRALQMDTSIPQLYFVMSQVKLFQRDFTAAINNAEKAIALNSSYADAYVVLAWILHFAGRPEEALDVMQRAIRLNPRVPAIYRLVLGAIHYALDNLDEAIAALRTGVEINPNYQQLRLWLAATYVASGHIEEAEWQAYEILAINPTFTLNSVETGFPFQDPVYRDRFLTNLKKAGLPE